MPVLRVAEVDALWLAVVNRLFCEDEADDARVAVLAFVGPARVAIENMLSSASRFDALVAIRANDPKRSHLRVRVHTKASRMCACARAARCAAPHTQWRSKVPLLRGAACFLLVVAFS